MGARGPAAKPTALRVLHGDKKNRINLNEPSPRNVPLGEPPEWMSPDAQALWRSIAPDLEEMGTAKISDWPALAALCESYSRWRRLAELAAKTQPVFKRGVDEVSGDPIIVKNPVYAQVRDATAELRVMLREFGLTPSARAGLRVDVTVHQAAERLFTTG